MEKTPLATPFKSIISNVNGQIKFNNNTQGKLSISGTVEETNLPLTIDGSIDPLNNEYHINFIQAN